ncbi:2-oxoacid:acceptor oxidoreductase family protein [Clostridium ihumii]|uniref:2-oxoacid:acceptor oxidoreductase family protein n=1 Tax=Clostridium ihumii TaxID=1470356 RepID=UPI003D32FB67
MSKKEILFTGLGGQGIVKSGVILAEAAVLEGKHTIQTQNYGPESRGGCCRADVIISDNDICYPRVENPDIILALSQSGLDKFIKNADENTIIITDNSIDAPNKKNVRKFDIFNCTENVLKNSQAINILCLGILAALTKEINYKNIEKAICDNVPKSTINKNLDAFNAGINMVDIAI